MDNRAEVREFLISRRAKITPQQAGCPTSAPAGCPGCAAARSPPSPGSASSTTPSSNAAPSPASRPPSSTRSPAPCSSTTPNEPTCSTSPTPPTAPAPACGPAGGPRRVDAPAGLQLGARRHHRTGDRPQRPDGPARRQPPRPGHARLPLRQRPGDPPNFARFTFLDDDSHRFYPDWDLAADTCVAILRTEAGRDPHDKALHDLVGELSTRSDGVPPPLEPPRRPPARRRHQALPPHASSATSSSPTRAST